MASTLLASTAIMLSYLIAVLMTGGVTGRSGAGTNSITDHHWIGITFNQTDKLMWAIKFFSILVFFLISFLMHIQSIRYYSHESMLINVPFKKITNFTSHRLTAEYVGSTVNLGSYLWSLGLRAFYFSFPLFLWLFGAIPMFVCCIFMVCMLYFLDVAFELVSPPTLEQTDNETLEAILMKLPILTGIAILISVTS